jgi:hypothetical protein
MGYAAIRYLLADVEYVARLEALRILVYGLLFFLILNNLHRQDSIHILLAALLGVGTLISVYALYQFLTGSNQVLGFAKPPAVHGRGSGTFICPNHLAGYLEMLIPVALAILILSRGGALTRILAAYAALMMAAGLAVSVSRGGYLSASIALCAFAGVLIQFRSFRRYVWWGLAAAVVARALFWPLPPDRRRLRLMFVQGQQENALGRLDLWRPARMWLDHPWFGVGRDISISGSRRIVRKRFNPGVLGPNDYLNALADWGAVGASSWQEDWVVWFGPDGAPGDSFGRTARSSPRNRATAPRVGAGAGDWVAGLRPSCRRGLQLAYPPMPCWW